MIILAVDTASHACGVALAENGSIRYEYLADHGGTHAVKLSGMIDEVLRASGLSMPGVDGFAVSVGPGSFTGLRIGISTVKGLALAASKPVAAVSSLEALALQCGAGACGAHATEMLICPILDARKNEVYTAVYQWRDGRLENVVPPQVASPTEALEAVWENITGTCFFIGSGALLHGGAIKNRFGRHGHIAPPEMNLLRPSAIAWLGHGCFESGAVLPAHEVLPLYLRRPDAEKSAGGPGPGRKNTRDAGPVRAAS